MTVSNTDPAAVARKLRELAEKTTPGEWIVFADNLPKDYPGGVVELDNEKGTPIIHWSGFDASSSPPAVRRANVAFIAWAHNNAENIAATIDSLSAEVARLGAELTDAKDPVYCIKCGSCGEEGCCPAEKCMYPGYAAEAFKERAESAERSRDSALREVERLRGALEKIKRIKPTPICDTGFQTGPLAMFNAAQRIARSALSTDQASGTPDKTAGHVAVEIIGKAEG